MLSALRLRRAAARSTIGLAAWLCASACTAKKDNAADTGTAAMNDTAAPAPAADASASAAALSDPQIAHVAVTANAIDSAAGALAATKAQKADVKDFARTMVRDHGAVNKEAVALAKRLNVTPQDNDVSKQLMTDADQARATLQGKSAAEFDRAYIDREVQYHQAVLDALDKTLIPGAQNADLKALLDKVRPNVAAHLERAKQIQGTLGQR